MWDSGRKANAEKVRAAKRAWAQANPEKMLGAKRKWREANREKDNAASLRWYYQNREHCYARSRKWAADNPEKVRASGRRQDAKPERRRIQRGDFKARQERYREQHVDELRIKRRAYQAKRRADPAQRAIDAIRRRIRHVIKSKTKGAFDLLGYSADELREHLARQFQSGMNWDNYGLYGDKWHIDHKRPVSSFNLPDELIECFALENLQPMWARDNLAKGRRLQFRGKLRL